MKPSREFLAAMLNAQKPGEMLIPRYWVDVEEVRRMQEQHDPEGARWYTGLEEQ